MRQVLSNKNHEHCKCTFHQLKHCIFSEIFDEQINENVTVHFNTCAFRKPKYAFLNVELMKKYMAN